MSWLMEEQPERQRYLPFLNQSGATIPAYAIIELMSDTAEDDSTPFFKRRLLFKKPTTKCQYSTTTLALNSGIAVPSGKSGLCTFAFDAPAWAYITSESGTAQGSDSDGSQDADPSDASLDWTRKCWGPVNGQWDVNINGWGFMIQSAPDLDNNRVLVRQIPMPTLFGKPDDQIDQNDSGQVSIWSGDDGSSLEDTYTNVTAYCRFGSASQDTWVRVVTTPWGWEIVNATC